MTFTEYAALYGEAAVCLPITVAKYLDVTVETVRKWADEGVLPAHRPSRTWVLITAEVEEWITTTMAAQAAKDSKKK